MLPSIAGGSHVLINTLAYGATVGPWTITRNTAERGDVIAFTRGHGDEATTYLKRVVALPGDTIAISNGKIVLNQFMIDEKSVVLSDRSFMKPLVVPIGSVFVLGDNRAESDDSRLFGPVPQSAITGKAILVIWPLGDIKRIR
jgi:signal peptidase I